MTIETKSLFYYVDAIVLGNQFLDFSEGGPNIVGELDIGARSPLELLDISAAAMNSNGGQDYTFVFNRITNKVTISAPGNFELNVISGPNVGLSVFGILGFTADRSGSNSYEGDTTYANTWRPQFWIQDFIPPERWKAAVKERVNEAGNGDIEVFSFGNVSFYQMNIKFITDIAVGTSGPLDNDQNAVVNTESFLTFAITKSRLEFMRDRDDPDVFDTILLENTPDSKSGTGFRLPEMVPQFTGYFQTGLLKFRKVNI